uniref:Uncharacterized protein n=1 Tax=viral metagenome TaxID=1070528 RepID=A0A6M3LY46_9ZZZZ
MGLIKTAFFHDEAYHKITSFEYHKTKQRLRIRLEVYPTIEKESILGTTEYEINEKSFVKICRQDAEKSVNMAMIKKISEDKILEIEKDLNKNLKEDEEKKALTQRAKDKIFMEEKDFAITEKMKEIGKELYRNFIEEFESKNRKTMSLLYSALKQLIDNFYGAIDA